MLTTPSDGREEANLLNLVFDLFPRNLTDVLESFYLPNFNDNFVNNEISNISLWVELIRKVNQIKQNSFKAYYKNEGFTCGVNPNEGGGCGDSIEYW